MRTLRNLLILALLATGVYYFINSSEEQRQPVVEKAEEVLFQAKADKEPESKTTNVTFKGDLYKWIGRTDQALLKAYGQPVRKDESAYGYDWWIYKDNQHKYVQFGVQDGTVETLYAIGNRLETEPVQMGDTYQAVNKKFNFTNTVTYQKGISSYSFKLKKKDLQMWPLVKINKDLFAQFYFDTFTKKLSAVRIMNGDVLLKQRPYEIEYRGDLPPAPDLSANKWKAVEKGMEQQIFDITNVMRSGHGKSLLKPDKQTAAVAFGHSKDMAENQYFSHYGLDGTGLKERLAKKNLTYLAAGENIAAQYPDAVAAMEGWLNSKGHREALLNNDYTHLGTGVYHFYYTQNFLKKP